MTDFMKTRCPVNVGDMFYRKSQTKPDRIEITGIRELEKPMVINELTGKKSYYAIRGRYLNHEGGSVTEREFSEIYFENPDVVIEQKGKRKD